MAEGVECAEVPDCAICFEPITECTSLPCACNVAYCTQCWDRSLAQAFQQSGQARCPTCRSPIRVNFDAAAADGEGRLVFTRETADHTFVHQMEEVVQAMRADGPRTISLENFASVAAINNARSAVVERLAEQAVPAQVRRLKKYGEAHSSLRAISLAPQDALKARSVSELKEHLLFLRGDSAGCVEKADVIERLVDSAGGSAILAASLASQSKEEAAPQCVCGGGLLRVSGRQRLTDFLEKRGSVQGSADFQRRFEHYSAKNSCSVICDLCEKTVRLSSQLWTCQNGDHTILHATAYDVCEDCFLLHALAKDTDNQLFAASGGHLEAASSSQSDHAQAFQ